MNRYYSAAAAVLVLGLCAGPAACAARTTPPAKPAVTAVHKKPTISDPDLEKAIRAKFAKSKINSHHFQVQVQGGVATLQGKTDVLQHKGTATRLAKNAGAVAVVNHIEVSEAAREKAAKNLTSGARRAQVKRTDKRTEP
jgi:hypothetical protein